MPKTEAPRATATSTPTAMDAGDVAATCALKHAIELTPSLSSPAGVATLRAVLARAKAGLKIHPASTRLAIMRDWAATVLPEVTDPTFLSRRHPPAVFNKVTKLAGKAAALCSALTIGNLYTPPDPVG